MTRRTPGTSNGIGLVAVLLAICLRLMAPVGWMPVASADGVTFTLCSGSGEQRLAPGKHGAPATPESDAAHGGPCAFSGLGTPMLPDVVPTVALATPVQLAAPGLATAARLLLPAIGWLRPPLRGPPPRA